MYLSRSGDGAKMHMKLKERRQVVHKYFELMLGDTISLPYFIESCSP